MLFVSVWQSTSCLSSCCVALFCCVVSFWRKLVGSVGNCKPFPDPPENNPEYPPDIPGSEMGIPCVAGGIPGTPPGAVLVSNAGGFGTTRSSPKTSRAFCSTSADKLASSSHAECAFLQAGHFRCLLFITRYLFGSSAFLGSPCLSTPCLTRLVTASEAGVEIWPQISPVSLSSPSTFRRHLTGGFESVYSGTTDDMLPEH